MRMVCGINTVSSLGHGIKWISSEEMKISCHLSFPSQCSVIVECAAHISSLHTALLTYPSLPILFQYKCFAIVYMTIIRCINQKSIAQYVDTLTQFPLPLSIISIFTWNQTTLFSPQDAVDYCSSSCKCQQLLWRLLGLCPFFLQNHVR